MTLTPKLTFRSALPLDAETLVLLKTHKYDLLKDLVMPSGHTVSDSLPRLAGQLERLVAAAASGVLPDGTVMLASGLVPDLGRYTLGWAASYLIGDRDEALSRLWQVRRVWQGETLS